MGRKRGRGSGGTHVGGLHSTGGVQASGEATPHHSHGERKNERVFLTGNSAKPYNTEDLGLATTPRQPKPGSLPTMRLQTPPAKPTPPAMPLVYKIQLMTRVDSTTNPVKSGSVARACSQFFTLSLVFNTKPTSTTARVSEPLCSWSYLAILPDHVIVVQYRT